MTEEYRKGIKDTVDVLIEYVDCERCKAECVDKGYKCRQALVEWVEKELEE